MTDTWRCFVAAPIDDELRAALAVAVAGWRGRPELDGLRWADPEGWHLTLAFLGATDPASVPTVAAAIGEVARAHEPFELRSGGVGAFPSGARARVVWFGIADPDRRLSGVASGVSESLGMPPAAALEPHITLARARRRPVSVTRWLGAAAPPDGRLRVDRLVLMRSHLGRGPARYEALATAELGVAARV